VEKFMALPTVKRFLHILKGTRDKNLPEEEVSEYDEKLTKSKELQ
jgi:hypothetical protein